MPSHVPDLRNAECRGISRSRKFHEIITDFNINTFAQCVKECTDALWISLRNSIKKRNKDALFMHLRKTFEYLYKIRKEA